MAGADWQEKQKQMFAQIPVKVGDIIDKSNWEKAKGLLPEQILATVKAGDWILKIGEYEFDDDYTEAYYKLSAKNNSSLYNCSSLMKENCSNSPDFVILYK